MTFWEAVLVAMYGAGFGLAGAAIIVATGRLLDRSDRGPR